MVFDTVFRRRDFLNVGGGEVLNSKSTSMLEFVVVPTDP